MNKPSHVYETFIRATSDHIWSALTNPEFTRQYFHGTAATSDWQPGSAVRYLNADGSVAVEGEVLEAQPPERLVITWRVRYNEEMSQEPASRVVFDIEPLGDVCRLRVTHDQFAPDSLVYPHIASGWSGILCSLKSLLETGEALSVA